MSRFAIFDGIGLPTGFFVEEIHGSRMRPIYRMVDVLETGTETGQQIKVGERQEQIGEEPNPDCLIPADAVAISEEQWLEFLQNQGRRRWENGAVVPYEPPVPPITQTDYAVAIQAVLDAKARERHYDNIHTAIGYRDDPNSAFAAEAHALFLWRSSVWTFSAIELANVKAGLRPQPSVVEFIAELPPFEWPGGPSVYDSPDWSPVLAYV